jgi:hypothetical protein
MAVFRKPENPVFRKNRERSFSMRFTYQAADKAVSAIASANQLTAVRPLRAVAFTESASRLAGHAAALAAICAAADRLATIERRRAVTRR